MPPTIHLGVGPTLRQSRVVIGNVLRTIRECDGVRDDTKKRFTCWICADLPFSDDGTVPSTALGLAMFCVLHGDEDAAGVIKLIEAIHDPRNVRFLLPWPRPKTTARRAPKPITDHRSPITAHSGPPPGLATGIVLFLAVFFFAAALTTWFLGM